MFKKIYLLLLLTCFLTADETWKNAIPTAKNFDWLQTASGEWVKGDLKGMYDRELEFDSDEFGLLTIDWTDVKQLISRSTTSLSIEGRGTVQGQLYIHDDIIVLSNENEGFELKREQIISLTNGGDTEKSYWSGAFSFGLTVSSGNTDKQDYTLMFNIKRQTSSTRFKIDSISNYSLANDVLTEDNARLSSSLDIFQTRKFFWRPAFIEISRDAFQNIDHKATYGAGVGYDIYASSKLDWSIFTGPAYQSTTFIDVLNTDDKSVTTPAIILTSNYDLEITKNLDLIINYQAYFINEESGDYVHHALITLETELIHDFKVDFTASWDRVENPTDGLDEEGVPYTPAQDDFKTIVSIGYSF